MYSHGNHQGTLCSRYTEVYDKGIKEYHYQRHHITKETRQEEKERTVTKYENTMNKMAIRAFLSIIILKNKWNV